MNMQITGGTGGTKFSEIYQQRTADGGALKGLDGEKHLRFKGGDTLYTHDSNKRHSLHFMDRASKHSAAAGAVKQAIDNELGAGAGDKIFKSLGLNKKVTIDGLGRISSQVNAAKGARLATELPGLLQDTAGQIGALRAQLVHEMGKLPDVPAGDKANQHQGVDYFRANAAPATKLDSLEKLRDEGVAGLSAQEAAAALKEHLNSTPTMPVGKFVTLMTSEHVSEAVGYFTGANTHGGKGVTRDSDKAKPENMQAAARELRDLIDDTLTAKEKADLKERVGLMRDLSAIHGDKVGLISTREDESDIQTELWAKSIAVSYGLFAGHNQQAINDHSGMSIKDAGVAARDLVTAMAIHYDTIFN